MAYFLGLDKDGDLNPLKIYDIEGNLIPNSILSLVDFTANFKDIRDLWYYLRATGSVKADDEGELVYLIDKGQRGSKTYNVVSGTNGIILQGSLHNFNRSAIRKRMHGRVYNYDFIEHLYAFYLKKFGIYNESLHHFKDLSKSPFEFRKAIVTLLKYPVDEGTRIYLLKILDILNMAVVRGNTRFFESNEVQEYFDLVDLVEEYFSKSDKETIILSRVFFSKVKNNSIAALNHLALVYQIINSINKNGNSRCVPNTDKIDIASHVDSFLDFTFYSYDKHRGAFRTSGGNRKVQERNVFDLGIFLCDYDEYEISLYESMSPPTGEILSDGEHEEFLEEEDFLRLNTTSEEQGIKLRITDGMKNSGLRGYNGSIH